MTHEYNKNIHKNQLHKIECRINEQCAKESENTSDCNAQWNYLNLNRRRFMKLFSDRKNSILEN